MTATQIKSGTRIIATIVEPWELGDRPLEGRIVKLAQDPDGRHRRATIQLTNPVNFRGQSCQFFEVVPRSASAVLDQLVSGPVDGNLTCISAGEASSGPVGDPRNRTAAIGMIATLELLP